MKLIERADATGSLSSYADQVVQEPVVVTVEGRPVAALIPLENADLETVSLATNPAFMRLIARSRVRHAQEGGLPPDEVRRRLGL